MSDELTQDLPTGYHVLDGCHNCKHLRDLGSYDGFDGYCAQIQPEPKQPPKRANRNDWKRFWVLISTRKVKEWASCDRWEAA